MIWPLRTLKLPNNYLALACYAHAHAQAMLDTCLGPKSWYPPHHLSHGLAPLLLSWSISLVLSRINCSSPSNASMALAHDCATAHTRLTGHASTLCTCASSHSLS
nr:hypothetical protein Iba_chr11fCG4400 [Ipomoea batatas]